MRTSLFLALTALGACGGSPLPAPAARPTTASVAAPSTAPAPSSANSSAPAPAANAASSEFAPTPYTAEQIRKATAVGRTYDFRTEVAGAPTRRLTIAFTKVTDAEVETRNSLLDEQGKEMATPRISTSTWDELRKHAEFPRATTVIADEKITVPAGTFECARYTVTEASGEVSKFYFAKKMPGPPILFMTDKQGTRVMTTTLIHYAN
ncbi:MAG: hypothetical protein ABIP89_18470 [Polyangiaceae bacterium]